MAPPDTAKPKRVSPYFAFCKKHRDDVKSRLHNVGQPTSASAITKALSELWRSLSDTEKQKYKISGSEGQERTIHGPQEGKIEGLSENRNAVTSVAGGPDANVAVAANIDKNEACEQEDSENGGHTQARSAEIELCAEGGELNFCHGHEGGADLAFPLARVKRIIKLDKDIRIVAADASILIAHASQLFLELLAEASYDAALKKKHKTVRMDDIKDAIRSDSRIDEFLSEALEDIFNHRKENESDSGDDADEQTVPNTSSNKKPKVTKKPPPELPSGIRRIADFFAASKAVPAETSNADGLS